MIQQALPDAFLDKCTDAERSDIESWWQSLSNDSSESMRIGTKPAVDRSKPFQQFIASRFAPRDAARFANF